MFLNKFTNPTNFCLPKKKISRHSIAKRNDPRDTISCCLQKNKAFMRKAAAQWMLPPNDDIKAMSKQRSCFCHNKCLSKWSKTLLMAAPFFPVSLFTSRGFVSDAGPGWKAKSCGKWSEHAGGKENCRDQSFFPPFRKYRSLVMKAFCLAASENFESCCFWQS